MPRLDLDATSVSRPPGDAPAGIPSAVVRNRAFRGWPKRPELWLAALLVPGAAALAHLERVPLPALDVQLYYQLITTFAAGSACVFLLTFGELLLRALPPPDRPRWRLGWIAASGSLALTLFLLFRPPQAFPMTGLLEASVLALGTMVGALTIFLPAAGFVTFRAVWPAARDTIVLWGPFAVYLATCRFYLLPIRLYTPFVIDPILLRMDLSLGFSPSEAIFAWEFNLRWVEHLSNYGYPLLACFITGVAATLHLAGAPAHARRCAVALFLVATLAFVCYRAAPAIGPLPAFPPLFEKPATDEMQAAVASGIRRAIVAGPDRIAGGPVHPRNAMPSLHTAFTLVALAAAWNWRRKFFWLCLPIGVVQIATALTLCVHYVVDLVAAVPFAALCWALADWLVRASGAPLPALAATGDARRRCALCFAGALVVALGALLGWARFAPIPPWLAWPLAGLIVGAPAWTAWRLCKVERPDCGRGFMPRPSSQENNRRIKLLPQHLLTIAVFCSGGVALVLEQIYEKYLSTLLGASRPATTIVLAVYFIGLALGAWWCPKKTEGAPRRLALLELFIAAWAGLVGVAFFAVDHWLGAWLAAADSSALALAAGRTAIAVLWILPPTLAMGAQFPTLAAVLEGHPIWRGRHIARFYSVNLAGAFFFTVLTPPLLFNTIGADGALWTIAALGASIGLALWLGLPRSESRGNREVFAETLTRSATPLGTLALAFCAGFGFFALEVVWFHLISAVCGASTYGFSILLAVVLLGLALGGRLADQRPTSLAVVLGGLVPALAISNALWPWTGMVMARIHDAQRLDWFWSGELVKFAVVALVALPPATLAGRIFPSLLRQFDAARAVGALCAANVVGCVVGALATGFLFIPTFGAERTLFLLALLAAAGWVATVVRRPRPRLAVAIGVAGLFLLACSPGWNRLELTRGYGVYLQPQLPPAARLAFFREDFATGFVTVVETPLRDRAAPRRTLLQNGKFDADDADEMPAQLGFGLVAALHAPAQENALVIGCGSGQTASLIARLGFGQVDIAEMSAAHLAAARAEFAHINAGVLDRANVHVHVEDGRNHLLRTHTRYDLIQIEVTSVWFAGATNLYSREFYALARERLAPGGVLVQWVQLHHLTPRELTSIFATAQAEFAQVSLWRVGAQACLLASVSPTRLNPAIWEKWRGAPELFDERLLAEASTPAAFAATQLLPAENLRALLARTPAVLNTDRNRWLEFQTPKYYLSRRDHPAENLRWLAGGFDPE